MSNRNATASWSGYSHQGMVGLLVTLREIRRIIIAGNQNQLGEFHLTYESYEDVALYRLLNGAPQFLSVHQVKAYYSNGHLFNSYSEVFTGKPIYQRDGNGKLIKIANQKVPTGNYEPGQWCNPPGLNYLHTTEAVGDWPAVFAAGTNPFNITRYPYNGTILNCGTDQISTLIIAELQSADFHNGNNGAANLAFHRFCHTLDEKIRFEHANKAGKAFYDIRFTFQEIFECLMSNVDVTANDVYKSRKLFFDAYKDVVTEEDIEQDRIDEVYEQIIKPINALNDEDFLVFLRRLNLNETEENLQNSQYYFNPEGLRQVFFRSLIDIIHAAPGLADISVHFKKPYTKNFVLTAILSTASRTKPVVQNIIDNLTKQNLLWENHSLINEHIDVELAKAQPTLKNVASSEESEEDKLKFMRYSGSKLVKRDNATNTLNDNGGAA
jgi:hypothetical protein